MKKLLVMLLVIGILLSLAVPFSASAEIEGDFIYWVENGEATIYGLAFGTYYLVETQAPEGYNKLSKPQRIEIDENSHTEAGVIIVENTAGAVLPTTGGMGTGIFTVTGNTMLPSSVRFSFTRKPTCSTSWHGAGNVPVNCT